MTAIALEQLNLLPADAVECGLLVEPNLLALFLRQIRAEPP